MPLSEHEQKILDEIEKNLATEDPRFADRRTRTSRAESDARRAWLGGVTFLGGFALLILFFVTRMLVIGLFAFGGMVAGIVLLASAMSAVVKDYARREARHGDTSTRSRPDWEEVLRKRFRRP